MVLNLSGYSFQLHSYCSLQDRLYRSIADTRVGVGYLYCLRYIIIVLIEPSVTVNTGDSPSEMTAERRTV